MPQVTMLTQVGRHLRTVLIVRGSCSRPGCLLSVKREFVGAR